MEVSAEFLKKFKCDICTGYLSRGPIYQIDGEKYHCGRCPSSDGQGIRSKALENLVKAMLFPCQYKANGCKASIAFEANETHEESCPYKYYCSLDGCNWSGLHTRFLEHCQDKHPNYASDSCKLTHNVKQSTAKNYLLQTSGLLFIIKAKVCTETNKIYHSVCYRNDRLPNACNFKYDIGIKVKDGNFTKHGSVASNSSFQLLENTAVTTSISGLVEELGGCSDITFTVTLYSAKRKLDELAVAGPSNRGAKVAKTKKSRTERIKKIETKVHCAETDCANMITGPVYQMGWKCPKHVAPRQECVRSGCNHRDIAVKCWKHTYFFCDVNRKCPICNVFINGMSLESHYLEVHMNMTCKAGTACTVRFNDHWKYIIVECDLGNIFCNYQMRSGYFNLKVFSPLLSEELYVYPCEVHISHPLNGRALKFTPNVEFNETCDWYLDIPLKKLDEYIHDGQVNINLISPTSKIHGNSRAVLVSM